MVRCGPTQGTSSSIASRTGTPRQQQLHAMPSVQRPRAGRQEPSQRQHEQALHGEVHERERHADAHRGPADEPPDAHGDPGGAVLVAGSLPGDRAHHAAAVERQPGEQAERAPRMRFRAPTTTRPPAMAPRPGNEVPITAPSRPAPSAIVMDSIGPESAITASSTGRLAWTASGARPPTNPSTIIVVATPRRREVRACASSWASTDTRKPAATPAPIAHCAAAGQVRRR